MAPSADACKTNLWYVLTNANLHGHRPAAGVMAIYLFNWVKLWLANNNWEVGTSMLPNTMGR